MAERIWVVHWDGPFPLEKAKKLKRKESGYVLYQLSGHHHSYGSNVLLYIGQTIVGISKRLSQHDKWIDDEYDAMKVRLGSISNFSSWKAYGKQKRPFPNPGKKIINVIEKLLIYANQPAYNVANKNDAKESKEIRIFNTGHSGSILPEISSRYFLDI